jgi:hypothetical protein
MRFRRRPFDVEARQWIGGAEFATPIINWILAEGGTARWHEEEQRAITPFRPDDVNIQIFPEHLQIDTHEGIMEAAPGDWILRDDNGLFFVAKPGAFDAEYEPVDAD